MAIDKSSKGNPKWVREERGKYYYEYQKDGEYWARGYFKTAIEAHQACLNHQEYIDMWKDPEKARLQMQEERNAN